MLLLATNLENEIREHGAKDYPHECCGAMLGTDGDAGREVRSLFPLINRRDDLRAIDFRSHRKIFAQPNTLQRSVDSTCWGVSFHPDHPARPSEFDREHAWPCTAM